MAFVCMFENGCTRAVASVSVCVHVLADSVARARKDFPCVPGARWRAKTICRGWLKAAQHAGAELFIQARKVGNNTGQAGGGGMEGRVRGLENGDPVFRCAMHDLTVCRFSV